MNAIVQKELRKGRRRAVDPVTPSAGNSLAARMDRDAAEKSWVADPDRPSHDVRIHRTWQPDRMHRAHTISLTQFLVCQRYERTAALASGAKLSDPGVVGRRAPWEQGTPAEQMIQAQTALRRADDALGKEAATLMRLLVLHNLPVSEIADARGEHREQTKGRVLAAIDRVAEHWGMT